MVIKKEKGWSFAYQTTLVLLILFMFGGSLGRVIFWDVLSELVQAVILFAIIAAAFTAVYLIFSKYSRWLRELFNGNKANRDK